MSDSVSLLDNGASDTADPEMKKSHWFHERPLMTSHSGLVRSTFSHFGIRFQTKQGVIVEEFYKEIDGGRRRVGGGEGPRTLRNWNTCCGGICNRLGSVGGFVSVKTERPVPGIVPASDSERSRPPNFATPPSRTPLVYCTRGRSARLDRPKSSLSNCRISLGIWRDSSDRCRDGEHVSTPVER